MWFIWIGVAMIALKLLDVGVFSELSWWWIALPFGVGYVWFELVEKRLGLDKKKRPGAFVRCAVTGVPIPLEELKYWSVDLQEAYATPQAVLQRHLKQQEN